MRGDDGRDFYQRLIQCALALHHYRNGNMVGAMKMWAYARDRLSRFGPKREGLDVTALVRGMRRALSTLRAREPEPFDPGKVPVLRLDP